MKKKALPNCTTQTGLKIADFGKKTKAQKNLTQIKGGNDIVTIWP